MSLDVTEPASVAYARHPGDVWPTRRAKRLRAAARRRREIRQLRLDRRARRRGAK